MKFSLLKFPEMMSLDEFLEKQQICNSPITFLLRIIQILHLVRNITLVTLLKKFWDIHQKRNSWVSCDVINFSGGQL